MPAIIADHLCKSYPLYARPSQKLRDALRPIPDIPRFEALKDISFTLQEGETLGVLGVNGAGKSTLLKLLAGVTSPTSGSLQIQGRVGALLELGAGFQPEYTGIENARLSLTIAGFSRAEIDETLPSILSFADIGDFAKAPVKVYSSGMFVRLAFACATAARPDILLVDEALSVGDLFFQAKCVSRMREMLARGTTLVFVSHDLGAVKSICSRCLLLNRGRMDGLGNTEAIARKYFARKVEAEQPQSVRPLAFASGETAQELAPDLAAWKRKADTSRLGDGRARFLSVSLLDECGNPIESASYAQKAVLRMQIACHQDLPELCLGYHIQSAAGVDVIYSDTAIEGCNPRGWKKGETHVVEWSFTLRLGEGSHNIAAVCSVPLDMSAGQVEFCDHVACAAQFTMQRRPEAKLYGLANWENEVKIQ